METICDFIRLRDTEKEHSSALLQVNTDRKAF